MLSFLPIILTLTGVLSDEVTSGNNKFAGDLYREISKNTPNNFVVSPFSAETVLTLALAGARGKTREELQRTLHLPTDLQQTANSFKTLLSNLNSRNYEFHTANKLYHNREVTLKRNFQNVATEVFKTEADSIDFSRSEQAAEVINQWVAYKTNNKIKELVTSDKLSSDTKAVLVNALYFKANWSSPFRHFKQAKRDFQTFRGAVSVNVMLKNDDDLMFNYAENQDLQAQFLELPFEGKEASMVFVLPSSTFGIVDLERRISEVLAPQSFTKEYVNMTIPKFKFDSKIDLKAVLQNLGVTRSFSPNANFRGITDNNLSLSDVIQKTFIDVHEAGVEAASATYTGLVLLSIQYTPEPKQFNVDHPFIFYIKVKDLIVFVGKVVTLPS